MIIGTIQWLLEKGVLVVGVLTIRALLGSMFWPLFLETPI